MDEADRQARVARYDALDAQRKELEQQTRDILAQMYATGMVRCWDCNRIFTVYADLSDPHALLAHRHAAHDRSFFDFEAAVKEMDAP